MAEESKLKYGVEDPDLEKALERWDMVRECDREKKLREQVNENIDYFTGSDQGWDKDEARSQLEDEGRPALTLNRISPILRLMQGARPKTEAAFYAVEESDVQTADIFNACKDHVESINKWEFKENDAFLNLLLKQRIVFEIMPSYDKDPRGEVKLSECDAMAIYPDPSSKEKDYSDMRYMFEELEPDVEVVKETWPEKTLEIDSVTGGAIKSSDGGTHGRKAAVNDQYKDPKANFYEPGAKTITVLRYWWVETRSITKMLDLTTIDNPEGPHIVETDQTSEEVQEILSKTGAPDRYMLHKVDYRQVKYMIFTDDVVLEKGETPWVREDGKKTELSERIPYLIVELDRIRSGSRDELVSIVESMKDPQRFHNKLASAIIQIIGTQAHSGLMYETGAMSKEWTKKLKKYGSKPGFNLELNAGGLNKVQAMVKGQPPQAHMVMAKEMSVELLDISGAKSLTSEQYGKSSSGKAIGLGQTEGANIMDWIYTIFRFAQHVLAELTRDAIQRLYDYEKVIRIKGPRLRYITINEVVYDAMGGIVQILNDVTTGSFDVVVTDRDSLPTMKIERFKYFSEMVKSGALMLPPPVLSKITLELMDDPDLKRIVEDEMGQYAQMMPPPGMVNPNALPAGGPPQ